MNRTKLEHSSMKSTFHQYLSNHTQSREFPVAEEAALDDPVDHAVELLDQGRVRRVADAHAEREGTLLPRDATSPASALGVAPLENGRHRSAV